MQENPTLSIHTRPASFLEEQYPGFPLPTAPLRQGERSLASTIHDSLYNWSWPSASPEHEDGWTDILKAMAVTNAMKEDADGSVADSEASQR